MVVRYRFSGVGVVKQANELLNDLRNTCSKVVGCIVLFVDRVVEVDFDNEPTQEEIKAIKDYLMAKSVEKVEIPEEVW